VAEHVAGAPPATNAALWVEQVGERGDVRFVHQNLL